ncbi:hypothetical protein GCM10023149_49860 [Mucilaginibacter gynuensis]|uniref:Lipopolysaccharide export system permease protein n=2 Tax=Mucilaginibacter gynuensis TaxID=1302236 RepID=A0ABP8HHF2_9SPHI
MFVLLMLFLFKYVDDLIGKGFEWYVILELMLYASATNVAMALPLSVLLSSIMTYGSLGENYELVAIKSAGISLRRAMAPMFIVVTLLAITAFVFSDYMLPVANLKYYSLLYDVRQQKSAKLLQEGVFSNDFTGYSIRVQRKGEDGQTLYGIMIYEKPKPPAPTDNLNVTFAKEGTMYRTAGDKYLVLKLKDGIRYEERPGKNGYNDQRQQLVRYRFAETEQKFSLDNFTIKRTDEDAFKSAFQMMNIRQLSHFRDSAERVTDSARLTAYKLLTAYVKYFNVPKKSMVVKHIVPAKKAIFEGMDEASQRNTLSIASNEAKTVLDLVKGRADTNKEEVHNIRRSIVEYQKKFTLSVACLVLFLIGAPLGAIIRKGGLGLPVVVSVAFFLLYHIISTIGEKGVKDGGTPPIIGMWIAIFVLTPIGIFLSYKAATDSTLFDMEAYKRFFNKLLKRKMA